MQVSLTNHSDFMAVIVLPLNKIGQIEKRQRVTSEKENRATCFSSHGAHESGLEAMRLKVS